MGNHKINLASSGESQFWEKYRSIPIHEMLMEGLNSLTLTHPVKLKHSLLMNKTNEIMQVRQN